MFEVIYLTGAPAAGQSTTAKLLARRVSPLEVFEFGERLTAHLVAKDGRAIVQEDVRRRSASVVTPTDMRAADRLLLEFATEAWRRAPVVIDSHPVTKESFGFRITPYALDDFARLAPTQIWVLYADPETTVARIGRDKQGRLAITAAEAALHTQLQASVAATYGMRVGTPVHLFNTSRLPPEQVAAMLAGRLGRAAA